MSAVKPRVILRVNDAVASLGFYRRLDFAGEPHDDERTAVVQHPRGYPLLVAAHGADAAGLADEAAVEMEPGRRIYCGGQDLDRLRDRLRSEGAKLVEDKSAPWGDRVLAVEDPDGYVVGFWEALPIADEVILRYYREAPARLRSALDGLTDDQLDLARAPGKWSIRQIVHHMVDSDSSSGRSLWHTTGARSKPKSICSTQAGVTCPA